MPTSSNLSLTYWLMPFIIVSLSVLTLIMGDTVQTNNGFGWDGVVYGDLAKNLIINNNLLSNYYAHRILPPAIIHFSLKSLGILSSNENIINSFRIFNLACLVGTSFIWNKISDNFKISLRGRWIGFAALFLNFHIGKQVFFIPVSTDPSGFFISALLLMFYLENKVFHLFLTTFFGIFIWPLTSFFGLLLLLFPRPAKNSSNCRELKKINIKAFGLTISFAFLLGLLLLFSSELKTLDYLLFKLSGNLKSGKELRQTFVTGIPSIILVGVALSFLIGSNEYLKKIALSIFNFKKKAIFLACAALLIPEIIIRIISNSTLPNANNFILMNYLLFFPPKDKLFLPFLTIASCWGPIFLMIALYFKKFCAECRKLGIGFVLIIFFTLPMMLACEPRFILIGIPFYVLAFVLLFERELISKLFNYSFAFLVVIFGQFWVKINYSPWSPNAYEGLKEFPKQLFFMHYGLWMSSETYVLQFIITIISIVCMKRILSKQI